VDSMQRYNPLTFLSWSLTWHFVGFSPFWFHFGNWCLHGLSTLLLYLVLRDILIVVCDRGVFKGLSTRAQELAAVSGALLWSLHPLRVEPVAWATDRTYCQAMFFLLGSLLCYLKVHKSPQSGKNGLFFWLSLCAYLCSMLSYSLGVTFFVVFILMDLFLLQRVELNFSKLQWQTVRPILIEKCYFALPALLLSFLAVMIRYRQSVNWSRPVPLTDFGFTERVMQALYVYAYYLWRPFFTEGLAPIYTTLISFDPFSSRFAFSALLVAGMSVLCLFVRNRWPFLLGLWIAYLVLLLPFLGIFEHPHFPVDRYSLLPSICFSVLASLLIARLTYYFRLWQITSVVSIVLVLLSWLTFQQVKVWENSETLFAHTIRVLENDPYRVQIMGRLAKYYHQSGQTEKSIAAFMALLAIKPTSLRAHSQLAEIYHASGRYAEELPHLWTMLEQQPDNPEFHFRLGVALEKTGKHKDANVHLRFAESLKGGAVPKGSSGESNGGI
jgi:tetratricopeptide (TPR) repeat protein